MNTKPGEKGQIVVVFVVALVTLLGLTALAIDGGMVYSDRRYAQSVADSSVLAGGGNIANKMDEGGLTFENFWRADKAAVRNDALNGSVLIAQNRVIDNNIPEPPIVDLSTSGVKHGVWAKLSPHNNQNYWDRYIEIQTRLTVETSTAFAHLFFEGPLTGTVDAVVRIKPRTKFAFGYAVASTSTVCANNEGGIDMDGNGDILISYGGIFSNSCIDAGGSSETYVCQQYSTDGSTCLVPGDVSCVGDCTVHGGGTIVPTPVDLCPPGALPENCVPPMPEPEVLPLNCIAGEHTSVSGSTKTYNPGTYGNINVNQGSISQTLFTPGLYCITGSLSMGNGTMRSVNADGTSGPGAVTFYIKASASGNVWTTTGGTLNINAPTAENAVNGAKAGFLLYIDPAASNASVSMQGNGSTQYTGIVYGPTTAISVAGGAGDTFNGQVVGAFVNITGGNGFTVNYTGFDPNEDAPILDLIR